MVCSYDEMFWGIGVAKIHGFIGIADEHKLAVFQGFGCNLFAWKRLKLRLDLFLHGVEHGFRCGDEEHLRVDPMLGLRQKVGGNVTGVACVVGYDAHLRRSGRHVYGHVAETHMLLGSHDILVAGTEDLAHLGHALCAVGHSSDGLHATNLVDAAYACYVGCHEDSGVDVSCAVGWGAEHNLLASSNLGWRGEHENGRKEGGCASGDVETNLLYGHALLPTLYARRRLNTDRPKGLCFMKLAYVVVGKR